MSGNMLCLDVEKGPCSVGSLYYTTRICLPMTLTQASSARGPSAHQRDLTMRGMVSDQERCSPVALAQEEALP